VFLSVLRHSLALAHAASRKLTKADKPSSTKRLRDFHSPRNAAI
jgi:hypothetical protein